MKITKQKLKQIIKEERRKLMTESYTNTTAGTLSIYDELTAAGLSEDQINDSQVGYLNGHSPEDPAIEDMLFNYYMDTNQIPYEYATGRNNTPDEWISMHWDDLESKGLGF